LEEIKDVTARSYQLKDVDKGEIELKLVPKYIKKEKNNEKIKKKLDLLQIDEKLLKDTLYSICLSSIYNENDSLNEDEIKDLENIIKLNNIKEEEYENFIVKFFNCGLVIYDETFKIKKKYKSKLEELKENEEKERLKKIKEEKELEKKNMEEKNNEIINTENNEKNNENENKNENGEIENNNAEEEEEDATIKRAKAKKGKINL
jgi:hypothetical protein